MTDNDNKQNVSTGSNTVLCTRYFRFLYYRIKNSIKLGAWAWKNPETIKAHNFKMLSDLLVLIMKVAAEDRHYMTHIAFVHPSEGEQQIVSIWAGAGLSAEPLKRIQELIKENSLLKEQH